MLTMADYGSFARWREAPWRRRGADYEALKARITGGLLAMLERRVPGVSERVVLSELSTPITTEGFTGHRGGSIYGLPGTPERYKLTWLGVETPLDELYLTGADAFLHGVVGAMMGGVMTAAKLLGGVRGFGKIMSATNRL
jgi:all-trans-retinol 13,14-reductase